ncbi:MAG: hypothetical protein K8R53_10300 [Bacteroidales bacterium]|nr:hypothetical protein [Bacteroidales bacterium]
MNTNSEDKTVAILSYIPYLGWIIALILHSQNKTELGAFHLRQTLGLFLLAVIFWWFGWIGKILTIALLVLWLIGLLSALKGERKPIPLIGDLFQNIFSGIN